MQSTQNFIDINININLINHNWGRENLCIQSFEVGKIIVCWLASAEREGRKTHAAAWMFLSHDYNTAL